MKKSQKIRNIAVITALFILAVIIGGLTFQRPKNNYVVDAATVLEKLEANDYIIYSYEIYEDTIAILDIRSPFEYERGHLEGAINIPSAEILNNESLEILKEYRESDKTIAIYGQNPEQANIPFMLLYQMGYEKVKVVPIEIEYEQNELIEYFTEIEISQHDINAFIDESVEKAKEYNRVLDSGSDIPKRINTVKKKKKRAAEGGC